MRLVIDSQLETHDLTFTFKPQIYPADSRKDLRHVLCKRIDGGHIGRVDHIDGEVIDAVRFGTNQIITTIFTNRLGQCLRDGSDAIDRVESRKDPDAVGD